jgi:UPF0755 protein
VRRAAFFLLLLLVAAASIAGWTAYRRLTTPYKGYAGEEAFVEIPAGSGPAAIGRALVNQGVVIDALTFRVALWRSGVATKLKAGDYRFDLPMTPDAVLAKIVAGEVYLRTVTFPEGLTVREMSRIFEARGLGSAAAFVRAAKDSVALVQDLDPSARDLEGYLYPETYSLSRHAGAVELVGMMVGRFHQVFTPELRAAALALGLTPRQTVTLASLVEKETAKLEERPVVAGVYLHRLSMGMALQCDPTVIYALEMKNQYRGNLTHENLAVDSPYNTYRYPGLPPGPIAAPSRPSIEAVANADPVDYLYFVSRNDGSHVFARTLEEHNRNVRKYQVEYFRLKRAQANPGR